MPCCPSEAGTADVAAAATEATDAVAVPAAAEADVAAFALVDMYEEPGAEELPAVE